MTPRTLLKVERWYPSSKTCAACGYVLESLDLSEREWTCPNCDAHHDRDLNAARCVLAEGLRVYAEGLSVSDCEAGTLVGDGGGIPGIHAWGGCQPGKWHAAQ